MNRTGQIWMTLALTSLVLTMLLSACVTMPSPGARFVMIVTQIPTRRQQLEHHPGLSPALRRGGSREDVKAGRLVASACNIENKRDQSRAGLRHGYVLLPAGVTVQRGEIIEIAAEDADPIDGPYARFFGNYVERSEPRGGDHFPYPYAVSGMAFRCGSVSANGRMRVEVHAVAKYWDYDLAAAEQQRNRQISAEELRSGRIAMGECSPGVDSWAIWKVRIPASLQVAVGDFIEASAGADEAPRSMGPLSQALRKVARPPLADFIGTQGRYTVSCRARAARMG